MVSYSLSIIEKKIKSPERGFQRTDNYKKEMWKIYINISLMLEKKAADGINRSPNQLDTRGEY